MSHLIAVEGIHTYTIQCKSLAACAYIYVNYKYDPLFIFIGVASFGFVSEGKVTEKVIDDEMFRRKKDNKTKSSS